MSLVPPLDAVGSAKASAFAAPNSFDRTDVLSAFLAPCRVQCLCTRLWQFTAPWGIELARAGPGFLIVLDGTTLVHTSNTTGDVALCQTDFAMLTREETIVLRDQPGSRVVSDESATPPAQPVHEMKHLGGGGPATRVLWGALSSQDDYTRQAFHLLPPLLFVRREGNDPGDGLHALQKLLLAETENPRPGSTLLVDRLLYALLIIALRATPPSLPNSTGIMKALSIPGLGVALAAMHNHPSREWSVSELAELAGLSRSKFSLRFVAMLGCPPFDYLRDVRMRLACQLLQESDHGIKEISARVGYGTEASFSRAFSTWCGTAPGSYRREKRKLLALDTDAR